MRVEIYDVRGARVATLRSEEDGLLPAGSHVAAWDGRTASGSRAAAGTYVARLVARDESGMILVTSTKLSLVH